jgi:hypothetical protein
MADAPDATSKWPGWAKGLTLAISGVVLGLGGCVAFMNDSNSALGSLGAIVFVGSLFAVPIGVIWFLVAVIKAMVKPRPEI